MQRRRLPSHTSTAHSPASNFQASNSGERGYVLLTLIFFVAVLAISLTAILPSIKQEIVRDREEEMIHRGAQYTRAIRLYFKKNGHYPAKIEDLESTNNLRFLRKRYKDPTVKGEESAEADFKILRFGDPGVRLQQPGQNPAAQALQAQAGANGLGNPISSKDPAGALSAQGPAQQQDSGDAIQNPDTPAQDANGNPAASGSGQTTGQTGDGSSGGNNADKSASGSGSPLYGGGAMVGVVSTNANKFYPAIREFNKKHHYNEWQFLYDPQTDRGGLPTGPWQPQTLLGQAGTNQPPGTPAGQLSTPVGQPAGNSGSNPEPIHDQQQ